MNPIYEKLFDSYCVQTLREVCPYDHESLEELLDSLSLGADIRLRLDDAFYERYLQWSADAFAVGLHLGLSLFHDEIRRFGAQQLQQRPGS
mgnify:FL=1